jgi:hypothetical protein
MRRCLPLTETTSSADGGACQAVSGASRNRDYRDRHTAVCIKDEHDERDTLLDMYMRAMETATAKAA